MTIADGQAGAIMGACALIIAAVVSARATLTGKKIDEGATLRKGYQDDIAGLRAELKEARLAADVHEAAYAKLRADFDLLRVQYWELYEKYAKEKLSVIGNPREVTDQLHALQTYRETIEAEYRSLEGEGQ